MNVSLLWNVIFITLERIHPEENPPLREPPCREESRRKSALIGCMLVVFARSPGGALHRVTLFSSWFLNFFKYLFSTYIWVCSFRQRKMYVEFICQNKRNRQGLYYYVSWFWFRYVRISLFRLWTINI